MTVPHIRSKKQSGNSFVCDCQQRCEKSYQKFFLVTYTNC